MYRQTSNIRLIIVGNKIVDHSDVVGTSPVGAVPTTSSFSTNNWLQWIGQRQLQGEARYIKVLILGVLYWEILRWWFSCRICLNTQYAKCRPFYIDVDLQNIPISAPLRLKWELHFPQVWSLFQHPDTVKTMISQKIQEESLRTYLFTYSSIYDSLSLMTLSDMFELDLPVTLSVVSKMIINEELMVGGWHLWYYLLIYLYLFIGPKEMRQWFKKYNFQTHICLGTCEIPLRWMP